jgi:hypothetical protein
MGDIIKLSDHKKKQKDDKFVAKPSEIAAVETIDYMREKLYTMSEESRMQFLLIVFSHIIKWVIRSGYYDRPGAMLLAWVEKKINDYSSIEKVGNK